MADLDAQVKTQLANIEAATGRTIADLVAAGAASGLSKHGQLVKWFKSEVGVGHGNANLLAHHVRQAAAGGPAPATDLLDAQYAGAKAALRPIYDELAAIAESLGDDVQKVVQKTGVSFRRRKQFCLVQAPSSKRIQLGLNLDDTPDDPRVKVAGGMCTHRIDITDADQIDDALAGFVRDAYTRAG